MIERQAIPEVCVITAQRYADARGWFSETYNARALAEATQGAVFVQDNQVFSAPRGVLRGLHFQIGDAAQDKLVRVLRGAIFDVAVDLRPHAPSFGRHVATELRAGDLRQLFVPRGFAHGYLTLEPDTEVFYKVSAYYSPAHERGVIWNDPDLAIAWPLNGAAPILSERDAALPRLRAHDRRALSA